MPTINQIIGVDFDNTLISYDQAIKKVALKRGLVSHDVGATKQALRDGIRLLPDGEARWQELQAQVYGPGIGDATLNDGVSEFFQACRLSRCPVYVVSHKTQFAKTDDNGVNLRVAAMDWMSSHHFFDSDGLGLSEDHVYFENSRRAKLERIKELECTHFVDDLQETFLEGSFPAGVAKILYSPHHGGRLPSDVKVGRTWHEISAHVWGQSVDAAPN